MKKLLIACIVLFAAIGCFAQWPYQSLKEVHLKITNNTEADLPICYFNFRNKPGVSVPANKTVVFTPYTYLEDEKQNKAYVESVAFICQTPNICDKNGEVNFYSVPVAICEKGKEEQGMLVCNFNLWIDQNMLLNTKNISYVPFTDKGKAAGPGIEISSSNVSYDIDNKIATISITIAPKS